MFQFRDSWVFIFFLVLPFLIPVVRRIRARPSFIFPSQDLLVGLKGTMKARLSKYLILLRVTGLIFLLLALARPQEVLEDVKTISEGVDIVLAIDTSTSMLAEDFKLNGRRTNRFEIVREVVRDFIRKRKDDRIGIVAFAARAYTVCPLTTDYEWLFENLDRIRVGMIEDATAIGSALSTSLNRLRTSKTKSRIIILLTDGVNNAGTVSPPVAAEAAKALKMKVYTIGVGTKGLVPYPMRDAYGRTVYQNIPIEIDEALLTKVAETTGGKHYLASDTETLKRIYDEINTLERSNIEHRGYREYTELFPNFLITGLVILALELLLANTVFLRVP